MTPIRLKMQAFGPYQGAVEIAFSGLRGKLFLITGSTGGGKTTILDESASLLRLPSYLSQNPVKQRLILLSRAALAYAGEKGAENLFFPAAF